MKQPSSGHGKYNEISTFVEGIFLCKYKRNGITFRLTNFFAFSQYVKWAGPFLCYLKFTLFSTEYITVAQNMFQQQHQSTNKRKREREHKFGKRKRKGKVALSLSAQELFFTREGLQISCGQQRIRYKRHKDLSVSDFFHYIFYSWYFSHSHTAFSSGLPSQSSIPTLMSNSICATKILIRPYRTRTTLVCSVLGILYDAYGFFSGYFHMDS